VEVFVIFVVFMILRALSAQGRSPVSDLKAEQGDKAAAESLLQRCGHSAVLWNFARNIPAPHGKMNMLWSSASTTWAFV
jgi:hypothetical protein